MIVGIIPARIASTRLPGKLLLDLNGKPVLQHTWEHACLSVTLDRVVIAAGDEQIAAAAKRFGAEVVEAFDEVQSGSDRVHNAMVKLAQNKINCRIAVNIQGDEPFVRPEVIDAAVQCLNHDSDAGVATPILQIANPADYTDPSVVKVVVDSMNHALYFSRSPIPHGWLPGSIPLYRHMGIYAFRHDVLANFVRWDPIPLELTEKLEQLRLLYNGVKIAVVTVNSANQEINTPEDLEKARRMFD